MTIVAAKEEEQLFLIVPEEFLKEFMEQVEETYYSIAKEYTPMSNRFVSIFEIIDDVDFENYQDELSSHILLGDSHMYELLEGEEREEFMEKADMRRELFLHDTITAIRFYCFSYQDQTGIRHYSPIQEVW